MSNKEYTIRELMAVVIARDLHDGEVLRVGVAMPVVEAAVRLAHLHHGPNMQLSLFGVRMNVAHLQRLAMPEFSWDWRAVRWAESYSDSGHRFDRLKDCSNHVFFISGVQIDAYGNTNLIGVGPDYHHLLFRGPGPVGTPTLSTHIGRYYIVPNSHTPRVFVERCDYISAFGWGTGGSDVRRQLGLPGGGPKYCVTPLCVFDFDENDKRMRLCSLHPGISQDEVLANTGFTPVIPDQIVTTAPPTSEELKVLRTRIDLDGILRR